MVRVSPPTCWVWMSRAPNAKRATSLWRMNDSPLGSRMMTRPGSVMTVRPPCWVSCRSARKSLTFRGPGAAAPGAIGRSATAGAGAAGSGVVTVGAARRANGAPPGPGPVFGREPAPCPGGRRGAGCGVGLRGGRGIRLWRRRRLFGGLRPDRIGRRSRGLGLRRHLRRCSRRRARRLARQALPARAHAQPARREAGSVHGARRAAARPRVASDG